MLLRWSCVAVVAAVLTGFAVLLVTGDYANDGPVVASVAPDRGVHAGDVVVLAGWGAAMAALAVLAAPRRARRDAGEPLAPDDAG